MIKTKPYRYKMICGDWSGDGHGMTEEYIVETNYPKKRVIAAYRKAVEISGVSLRDSCYDPGIRGKEICNDYEDNLISREHIAALGKLGIDFENYTEDDDDDSSPWESYLADDGTYSASRDDLTNIFFAMVRSQLPDFEYEIMSNAMDVLFEGYGYGCF